MKVLSLCENSKSQPLKYNNKTNLPGALLNYAPLPWLFCETIKGNGAISEVSGKEPPQNHRGGLLTLLKNFFPSRRVSE